MATVIRPELRSGRDEESEGQRRNVPAASDRIAAGTGAANATSPVELPPDGAEVPEPSQAGRDDCPRGIQNIVARMECAIIYRIGIRRLMWRSSASSNDPSMR